MGNTKKPARAREVRCEDMEMHMELNDRLMSEWQSFSARNAMRHLAEEHRPQPTDQKLAEDMRRLARSTDLRKNAADLYGDGDQSDIPGVGFGGDPAEDMRKVWAAGSNFNPGCPPEYGAAPVSALSEACFKGDLRKASLEVEATAKGSAERLHLLEQRDSLLRINPLLSTIVGSRISADSGSHVAIARLLLDAGARNDPKDVAGYSAIHHCTTTYATAKSIAIGAVLVERGADVNCRNRFGCVPLTEAVMSGREDTVEFLCKAGADPGVQDLMGFSPSTLVKTLAVTGMFSKYATRREERRELLNKPVELHNLQGAAHLNKRTGRVVGLDIDSGRFVVKLDAGIHEGEPACNIKVKVPNLRVLKPEDKEETDPLATTAAGLAVCAHCGKQEKQNLKFCASCNLTRYCNRECQKAHWPRHKEACRQVQRKAATVVIDRDVVTIPNAPPGQSFKIHNWASNKAYEVEQVDPSQMLKPGKILMLKIQRPMPQLMPGVNADPGMVAKGELMVYDRKRTLQFMLPRSSSAYDQIYDKICTAGVQGAKAYFSATVSASGHLTVDVGNVLPVQPW